MNRLLEAPRGSLWLGGMALAGLVIFSTALAALMLPYSRIIETQGGADLTCLHVPFTVERAAAILTTYDATAREAVRALHVPGDTLFPVGYALLYAGLVGLVAREQSGRWRALGRAAMWMPVAAMVLDWTENAFILRMVAITEAQGVEALPAWLPLLGGLAGSLKYLCLSMFTPLIGLSLIARSLVDRDSRPAHRTVVIYGVVAVMLLFNVGQVVTGVLPCLGGVG
ncbi:MAG: hypothetical protein Kow0077_30490 [Anaerolineae bacterium]